MLGVPLPEVASQQLIAFMLVLARVGGLFAFAPVFSSRLIPVRVRLIVAGALSLALTPLAGLGQEVPSEAVDIAGLLIKETIVGLAFALAVGIVAAAVQAAAGLLDILVGFSYAQLVDPMSNTQSGALGQLYSVFAVMIFLFTGSDHLVVMGLARSYELLPLGSVPSLASLGSLVTEGLSDVAVIGIAIAAPVMIALLITDVAFAVVSRAVPQMNVLFVGLPAKILLGLAVVAASLPFVSHELQSEFETAVMRGLQALAGG